MRANQVSLAFMLSLVLSAGIPARAEERPGQAAFPSERTSSALREGTWVWRSGYRRHFPGMSLGTVVQIGKSEGEWFVTFFNLSHTQESIAGRRPPQVKTEGRYPVHVTNGILHIQQPGGVLKHSCRFHRDLLQFPAVVRVNERTFNLTFSEVQRMPDSEDQKVSTWSYTWTCSAAPSEQPSGKAILVAVSPRGKQTVSCLYKTEKHGDGPSLVFQRQDGDGEQQDRIVWHRAYSGLQIYESASWKLRHMVARQETYQPAGDELKDLVRTQREKKPNKPDAGDGK